MAQAVGEQLVDKTLAFQEHFRKTGVPICWASKSRRVDHATSADSHRAERPAFVPGNSQAVPPHFPH